MSRTLKPLLSDDCKTVIVYSVYVDPNQGNRYLAPDWKNAVPVYECGSVDEANAFVSLHPVMEA